MQLVITKILPIFLLISVGMTLRSFKVLSSNEMQGIKKIIIKVALPVLLFKIFFNMELKKEYIVIIGITIGLYLLTFSLGRLLRQFKHFSFALTPYLMAGCAFGLLGVPLFEIVFGEKSLNYLAILGIGNELFIWFILMTLIKYEFNNEKLSLQTIVNFIKSPIIICVVTGLLINIFNLNTVILNHFILKGLYDTVEALATIASPLILIITGFDIVINKHYFKQSLKYVSIRLSIMFLLGYAFKLLLLDRVIQHPDFNHAFFTFLIISPPIALPIIVSEYHKKQEDIELAHNVVVMSIIACILLFFIYVLLMSLKG